MKIFTKSDRIIIFINLLLIVFIGVFYLVGWMDFEPALIILLVFCTLLLFHLILIVMIGLVETVFPYYWTALEDQRIMKEYLEKEAK